jgi:hypothetical protein
MAAGGVSPVDIGMDKFSAGMWPYENMWTEDGGYKPNDERRAIAEAFFKEVEEGKSLAFFYVDERNPLFAEDGERSPHRTASSSASRGSSPTRRTFGNGTRRRGAARST